MDLKTQKDVFGFKNDTLYIFKGDTYNAKETFKHLGARYCKFWGWYLPEPPEYVPTGTECLKLKWDLVGNEDGSLKHDSEIKQAINSLIYEPSLSEYQGEIGQRLVFTLTVDAAIALDGAYGPSTMHIMSDKDKNVFVWTTAAKTLNRNETYTMKGTIKDHREYKGTKQTILTRCKIKED